MVVSTVTGKLASAADRLMHAAQYLEGVAKIPPSLYCGNDTSF